MSFEQIQRERTELRRDGDRYLLRGQKYYISGVEDAHGILVIARQRRAEYRGKAGADTGHQQDAPVGRVELEQAGQLVGQRAAHLHGRAFAADGRAEQVRDHGPGQHQRRHTQRHDVGRIVDLVDQQVVPRFHAAAPLPVPVAQVGEQLRLPARVAAVAGRAVVEKEAAGRTHRVRIRGKVRERGASEFTARCSEGFICSTTSGQPMCARFTEASADP